LIFKSLASLGIGAAQVDTRLNQQTFYAGDSVQGVVFIQGGQAEQQIDDIYLYLVIHYLRNNKKTSFILQEYQLSKSFVIQANETKEIPFQIHLPLVTPMSTGSYPIYLKTGLDIKMAIDPSDEDLIEVLPHPTVQNCLKQIEDSEFILYQIYNQYDPGAKPFGFQQVFQFRPIGRYHGYIDELNVVFNLSDSEVLMNLEMIRANQSFYTTLSWNPHELGHVYVNGQQTLTNPTNKLKEILSRKLV
jgi:sporulation-control protein